MSSAIIRPGFGGRTRASGRVLKSVKVGRLIVTITSGWSYRARALRGQKFPKSDDHSFDSERRGHLWGGRATEPQLIEEEVHGLFLDNKNLTSERLKTGETAGFGNCVGG